MNDPVKIAVIVAVAPTLLALAAVVNSLRNSRKLDNIHIDLNSRLTQLLAASATSERATGRAEGLAEGRNLSVSERADRVTESERVEDRAEGKSKEIAQN